MDADGSSASGAALDTSPIDTLVALLDRLAAAGEDVDTPTLRRAQSLALAARAADQRKDAKLQSSSTARAAVNADLQQIGGVAAHDLREPLRQAETLVAQIAEDIGSAKPLTHVLAEAHDDLQLVSSRLRRLRERVAALAEFARLEGAEAAWRTHSLTALAHNAATEMGAELEASGTRLTIDPLPDVTGDGAQLQRLFREIIRNAADHGGRPGVAIRIGEAPPRAGWRCVSIADDGIGVPSEHAERVFQLFLRLRPDDAKPGLGLGLSLCRRIMTLHGGLIRLDPPPPGQTGPTGAHVRLMFPPDDGAPLGS